MGDCPLWSVLRIFKTAERGLQPELPVQSQPEEPAARSVAGASLWSLRQPARSVLGGHKPGQRRPN